MSFDNLCKLLSEKYPATFASWVLGTTQTSVKVLKTELSIEPIRADYVTFLQLEGRILHLEFQTKIESTPPLPLRMLDYWVRLYLSVISFTSNPSCCLTAFPRARNSN
jgi:predicted transposase YdaD